MSGGMELCLWFGVSWWRLWTPGQLKMSIWSVSAWIPKQPRDLQSKLVNVACSVNLGPFLTCVVWRPGPWFNIKMLSYQYRKSHCGDKTVVRSSYLYNGISYTGKTTSLYWIRALDILREWSQNLSYCIYLVRSLVRMVLTMSGEPSPYLKFEKWYSIAILFYEKIKHITGCQTWYQW